MSIASVSNRWLNRLYKILAIMLVCLAVLISAFRLLLPYVEHYRQDFQNYINNNNQTNFVIGGLGMSWRGSGPTLIANKVTLIDTEDAHITIEHIEIQVDFWETIMTQQLISSNLILEGAIVNVDQRAWNSQDNNNINSPQKKSITKINEQSSDFQEISNIFLNRINRFSLRNSQISIHNDTIERSFHINNLHWLNDAARHQAQGNIIVNELSSNNLSLQVDISGTSFDDLKGSIYVEANHLDITPWLDSVLVLDNDNTKADIGFSAWLKVKAGSIDRLQVALHENQISWQAAGKEHKLALSEGQLLLVKGKQPESFKLFSTPFLLQFNKQEKQEYIVQLNKTADDFSVYLSAFDLSLISQVSPLFISEQGGRDLLSELAIRGQANEIYFKKTAGGIKALASFTDTSTQYSQAIPGIKNLSGQLSYTQENLHLKLAATQGALDFNQHFIAPIPYQTLNASVDLSFVEQGWQLEVNDIALSSNELNLTADLAIESLKNTDISMSLLANITEVNVSEIGHYYPLTSMSSDLVDYLNNALIGGKATQAQVLLNGPLASFPFNNNEGIFVVDAELEDATFKFDEQWPAITTFSANLNFTNNSMLITGRSGSLVGLDVNGVQAAIDDLANERILVLDTLIKPSPAIMVTDLMTQSPLKESVGTVLEQLQVSGDINGEFHLNLPLNATEKVLASGLINFVDNNIALQTPQMNFSQVTGQLSFENEKITTKDLSVNWQGLPLKLAIKGMDKADYYDTNIAITADWQPDAWIQHIPPRLKKYFDGQLQFQGDLSLFQHHNGGFSYQFNIDSNLQQIQLELPQPYNKVQQIKVPLKIAVAGQLEQSTFNAFYGDQLRFFGVLEHDASHFSRAHLVLGNEQMLLPTDGFHITTKLAQADFNVWQPLISDIIDTVSAVDEPINDKGLVEYSPSLFSTPERIRGTITQLELLGQTLNNVSFNLLDKTHWWLLQLNAKETRSRIKFYPDWLEQGVDINADFIHLTTEVENKIATDTQEIIASSDDSIFDNMPKINLHCDRCQIDELNLGQVNLSLTRRGKDVIEIEHFNGKREQAQFSVSGQWQKNDKVNITNVTGELALKDIEYELEQLGYGSIIRDSGGKLNVDVNWQGGPHDFSFTKLNGELNARIDDGYLAEVSDKARIFSVLSLQSIVRKLTLDFRDIFSDGMFYQEIKGDYSLEEGVLYTDNTRMNGTAGNLYIKGNTSFATNILDYKMSYKPNLTSSLPVLAWIATLNPVVFLAGVAIDQVITSQVVSEFNFELTGNASEPNFREVNRKSRDVSVGRSTPPTFVDNTKKNNTEKNNTEEIDDFEKKMFEQYSPPLQYNKPKADEQDFLKPSTHQGEQNNG
ncbi:YhdP family protein [Candidatus Colwellia aromaticivorans]|uniref:YhdP family protein n=1 Tax=Candidatus Colwellia aromaticivorans TaxID=2267621 RepID=UPI000DF2B139|nr:YhdP family protein [Candidatus Colwellia aromaticivorans]